MSILIVKYSGIDIEYQERDNRWRFELDGKERHADSLKNAKVAIDTPPKEKKKPFEKITVFLKHHWKEQFEKVIVTSFVVDGLGKCTQAWITDSEGKRSKESLYRLITDTSRNHELMREYQELTVEYNALGKKRDKVTNSMVTIQAPTFEK